MRMEGATAGVVSSSTKTNIPFKWNYQRQDVRTAANIQYNVNSEFYILKAIYRSDKSEIKKFNHPRPE